MSRYKRYERYKDSGVEWIGEIPEHWEIKKIKYISNITMGQSPKSEECSLDETGLPFLQGNAEFTSLHPIPKIYCNTANKFSKVNDILLSVRAPVGAMNISDRVYGIGRGLCAITANKVQVRYLWYSMNVSLEELFISLKVVHSKQLQLQMLIIYYQFCLLKMNKLPLPISSTKRLLK